MSRITIDRILKVLDMCAIPYKFSGNSEFVIEGFSSLNNYKANTVTWVKRQENIPEGLKSDTIALAVVSEGVSGNFRNVITTENSKRAFFMILDNLFCKKIDYPAIGNNTYIGPNVKLGENVRIGHNCSLDGDISIGDNTIIWNNVSIINKVVIGCNSEIQSGCVIGHDGFGYTENDNHEKTMVKHFGGVIIGDNVLISSNVCVVRGTIDDTIIEDGAKIDNLSHIAHNCYLGKNSALAFPCFLGGSSRVENNGYIAGGIIRNQCIIHENGFVGMGAVVTKDVLPDTIVIGNPAHIYKKNN